MKTLVLKMEIRVPLNVTDEDWEDFTEEEIEEILEASRNEVISEFDFENTAIEGYSIMLGVE